MTVVMPTLTGRDEKKSQGAAVKPSKDITTNGLVFRWVSELLEMRSFSDFTKW